MIDVILVPLLVAGPRRQRPATARPRAVGAARPGGDDARPPTTRPWILSTGPVPQNPVLDEGTAAEAEEYARAEGLDVVDLVPADLPVTAARDLAREVDPRAYREHRLAVGHSAGAALLVAPALLERSGASVPGSPGGAQPADVIGLARRIRPYADRGAAIVVAPRLRAGADDLRRRAARLRASGVIVPLHLALDAVPFVLTVAALAAGLAVGPRRRDRVLPAALPGLRRHGPAAARPAHRRPAATRARPLRPGPDRGRPVAVGRRRAA